MVAKGGSRIMLLLVAVTPPAVAYSTAGAMLRPQTAAAVGQAITRARSASVPYPAHFGRRSPALRSQVFPAQLANAMHSAQVSFSSVCSCPAPRLRDISCLYLLTPCVLAAFARRAARACSRFENDSFNGIRACCKHRGARTGSTQSNCAAWQGHHSASRRGHDGWCVSCVLLLRFFHLVSTKPSTYCIGSDLSSNTAWMLQGRRVLFDGGVGSGVVLWQRIPLIFILRDDEGADSVSYTSAVVQPESATLTITPNVLGQVLDALGRPIDSTVSSRASSSAAASLSDGASQERSVFGDATLLADMATISRPMHTGVTAVDALTPIGKGNMFVVYVSTCGREKRTAAKRTAAKRTAARRSAPKVPHATRDPSR